MEKEIKNLSAAVANFILYINKLPPESLYIQKSTEWGPCETLIHLVYWHEYYVKIISESIAGKKPEIIKDTLKSHNALAVIENKEKSIDNLLERLDHAQDRLEKLCSKPNSQNIKIFIKTGGKERKLKLFIRLVAGHFNNHRKKLIRRGFK